MTIISSHRSGSLRAIVVWYWADDYGNGPSDSCRMFWIEPAEPRDGGKG